MQSQIYLRRKVVSRRIGCRNRAEDEITNAVMLAIGYDSVSISHIMLKARLSEPRALQVVQKFRRENLVESIPPPAGTHKQVKAVYILTNQGKTKVRVLLTS